MGRLDYLPFLGSLGSKVFLQNHFTAIETFDILKNLVKVLGKKHDMKRTTFFSISRSFSYLPLKLHNTLILWICPVTVVRFTKSCYFRSIWQHSAVFVNKLDEPHLDKKPIHSTSSHGPGKSFWDYLCWIFSVYLANILTLLINKSRVFKHKCSSSQAANELLVLVPTHQHHKYKTQFCSKNRPSNPKELLLLICFLQTLN